MENLNAIGAKKENAIGTAQLLTLEKSKDLNPYLSVMIVSVKCMGRLRESRTMSEIVACIGISIAVLCVSIVGCSLMLFDKISELTHEIWELRMDLKRGENDE